PRPSPAHPSRHHHWTILINVRRRRRTRPRPHRRLLRSRHSAHLRRHHGNLRRPSKTRPPPGRSLARPRRNSLAHLLARNASESSSLSHRRWPAHLHALHGRNRRHLLPYRQRQHTPSGNLGPPPAWHHP